MKLVRRCAALAILLLTCGVLVTVLLQTPRPILAGASPDGRVLCWRHQGALIIRKDDSEIARVDHKDKWPLVCVENSSVVVGDRETRLISIVAINSRQVISAPLNKQLGYLSSLCQDEASGLVYYGGGNAGGEGDDEGIICRWDPRTGEGIHRVAGANPGVMACAQSSGLIYCGMRGCNILIYGKSLKTVGLLRADEPSSPRRLTVSAQGPRVAASIDGAVLYWNLDLTQPLEARHVIDVAQPSLRYSTGRPGQNVLVAMHELSSTQLWISDGTKLFELDLNDPSRPRRVIEAEADFMQIDEQQSVLRYWSNAKCTSVALR